MGEESNKRGVSWFHINIVTDCASQTGTPTIEKNAEALLIFCFEQKDKGEGALVFQTVGNGQKPSLNMKKGLIHKVMSFSFIMTAPFSRLSLTETMDNSDMELSPNSRSNSSSRSSTPKPEKPLTDCEKTKECYGKAK
ncbi:hypothetical protein TNCV_1783341 [Trichonephila clavipes]|nr:hypothetical protein TNCV_1783341 [Trichonephila clavipes]